MFRLVYLTFYGERRAPDSVRSGHIHEAPPVMTAPLIILAVLSALAGFAGLPVLIGKKANLFGGFLERVFAGAAPHLALTTEAVLIAAATASALIGIYLAFIFYRKQPDLPGRTAGRFPRANRLLVGKYFVDEAYDAVLVRPARPRLGDRLRAVRSQGRRRRSQRLRRGGRRGPGRP